MCVHLQVLHRFAALGPVAEQQWILQGKCSWGKCSWRVVLSCVLLIKAWLLGGLIVGQHVGVLLKP